MERGCRGLGTAKRANWEHSSSGIWFGLQMLLQGGNQVVLNSWMKFTITYLLCLHHTHENVTVVAPGHD
jgi:hypothetical protein